MKKLFVLLLFLYAVNLNAYVSSDGDAYNIQYNKHGAVLTSVNIKHFIENNAGVKQTSKKLKLYLGKDCDAFSNVYGKGSWGWANGGFVVEFEIKSFGFARQELDFDKMREMEKCRF